MLNDVLDDQIICPFSVQVVMTEQLNNVGTRLFHFFLDLMEVREVNSSCILEVLPKVNNSSFFLSLSN